MCNSSSSVFNRTSPSLLHTFVVDTLLNSPMSFNIILNYTNTSGVNAFRRLLVKLVKSFTDIAPIKQTIIKYIQCSDKEVIIDYGSTFVTYGNEIESKGVQFPGRDAPDK